MEQHGPMIGDDFVQKLYSFRRRGNLVEGKALGHGFSLPVTVQPGMGCRRD
jgi:hypothetical protein